MVRLSHTATAHVPTTCFPRAQLLTCALQVEMAHKVLSSDMAELINAMRLAQQYSSTLMDGDYRRVRAAWRAAELRVVGCAWWGGGNFRVMYNIWGCVH